MRMGADSGRRRTNAETCGSARIVVGRLATMFETINESDNGKIFPGARAGIRFTAFTENHMNVGMDFAVGWRTQTLTE
jgi:hypothetical protein